MPLIQWDYNEYAWPFLLSVLIAVALLPYAWPRREVPASLPFLGLIVSAGLWSLLSCLQVLAVGLAPKVFLANLRYVPITLLPVAWLAFALAYGGRRRYLGAGKIAALCAVPLVTLALVATNPLHGLMFKETALATTGPVPGVARTYGLWFWVHTVYSYGLLAAGAGLVVHQRLFGPALYRSQATFLLAGVLAPVLVNLVFLAAPSRFGHIDLTPVGFIISGVFFTWAVFPFRRLDLRLVAWAAAAESLPDAVIVLDAQRRVVDLNPSARLIFGEASAGAIGRPVAEGLRVLDRIWPMGAASSTAPEVEAKEVVLVVRGERRSFDIRISPVGHRFARGPEQVVVVLRDVTERKRAEEALRQSEARYRALVEHAPEAIVVLDVEAGCFVDCNSNAEVLYGLSRQALLETGPGALSPETQPDGQVSSEAAYEEIMRAAGGEVRAFEWVHQHAQGWEIPCEVCLVRLPSAGRVLVRGSITNISERKQVEQALHESEERLRLVIDAMPAFISYADADQRYRFVNRHYEEHFGLLRSEIVGRHIEEILGTPAYQAILPHIEVALSGRSQSYHTTMEFEGLGRRTLEVAYIPNVGPEGRVRGYYVLALDVTGRKQDEQERDRLIGELEAKNAELERFTYTVSHDLKSPLVTIKGFLGMLHQDAAAGDAERMQQDIKLINEAADKMRRLLDELLDLSRIGRLVNLPEEVALSALAREAANMVAGQIKARGVMVEIDDEMPVVFGDRVRLLEVFQNLLDNAVKFIGDEPAPRIEIGTRHADEADPSSADPSSLAVVCYVRDNGIGIRPKYQEKIFGLFNQLRPQGEGTGIGLALARRIVEVHGGRLWVESAGEGHGSTFCFTLPKEGVVSKEAG